MRNVKILTSNWNFVLLTTAIIVWGISIFLMMNGQIFRDGTVVVAIVLLLLGLGLWKTWITNRMKKAKKHNRELVDATFK